MPYTHLSKDERLEISILKAKGYSLREIARSMNRSHSTLSRELRRCWAGNYDSSRAHNYARVKRRYSKYQGMKIRSNPELEAYVHRGMSIEGWSPEEIAGRIKAETAGKYSISWKSVYKYIRSRYGHALLQHLRYRGQKRKYGQTGQREMIPERVWIDDRPRVINELKRFGDFEGDTLGRPRSASSETLVGLLERKSGYLLAKKVDRLGHTIEGWKELLDGQKIKSLTLDNGVENIRYRELGVKTYFCHPYSSWEKGRIENAFGRLRKYIPKKADLAAYSDEQIKLIIDKMNNTPRKFLNYRTPKEIYFSLPLTPTFNFNSEWCT